MSELRAFALLLGLAWITFAWNTYGWELVVVLILALWCNNLELKNRL